MSGRNVHTAHTILSRTGAYRASSGGSTTPASPAQGHRGRTLPSLSGVFLHHRRRHPSDSRFRGVIPLLACFTEAAGVMEGVTMLSDHVTPPTFTRLHYRDIPSLLHSHSVFALQILSADNLQLESIQKRPNIPLHQHHHEHRRGRQPAQGSSGDKKKCKTEICCQFWRISCTRIMTTFLFMFRC